MNSGAWPIVVLAIHWLLAIGLSLRVITQRAPVGVSMAWIALMVTVPVVGTGAYLFVGEKRLGRRRTARMAAGADALARWCKGLQGSALSTVPLLAETLPIAQIASRVVGFPVQSGNRIELLDGATAMFDALIADIDAARRTCDLAFYIWHDAGRVGDVTDALIRAAQRGVRCRAIGDALGSKAFLHSASIARLRAAGIPFQAALPTGPIRSLFARADLRNHRKIVVIDARVAYAGSQNLVDPRYFMQDAGAGQWIDAMVRLQGPVVASLAGVFEHDWAIEAGQPFQPPSVGEEAGNAAQDAWVQVVPSGPGAQPQALQQLLLTTIYAARRELIVTTPYLVPDDSLLLALCSAAQRGVEVTLIVPQHTDSRLVRFASAAHFDDLLSAGVGIALFGGGLLHTKSITIDGVVSLLGSVNLDMRSLWLNFELSLIVYDRDFTARMRALQQRYLDDSEQIDASAWGARPPWQRLVEDAARLIGPVL